MKLVRSVAACLVAMACTPVLAEVKLASVFGDHMVLQRDKAVRVWGTATPGKTVTVRIADHTASAKADEQGRWLVRLGESKADNRSFELVASEQGGNTVTVTDVLFGDVWVASGQSNMEFGLSRAKGGPDAAAAATDTKIRLLTVPHAVSDTPLSDQPGKWVVCSAETASKFSAVAYYFAREIRAKEHVPIGVVGTYWGGTPAEAWTPKSSLDDAEWDVLWEKDRKQLADYPEARKKWEEQVKAWEAKPAASRGRKPGEPRGPQSPNRPAGLWNAMVAPVVPMSITGVIWYQGEANAGRAQQYRSLFPTMIEGWREQFRQADVPFLFVQLANYGRSNGDSDAGSSWAELREAQTMTLSLKKTGMAVAIDVGDPKDIHPTDKETVGKRLALAAGKVAYGRDVEYAGPTYKSMKVSGNKATLTFTHADGLGTKSSGDAMKGFTIAGEDKRFVPAEAHVEGAKVVVSSPAVTKPVAVRYGWAEDPETSLYNGAALPMVPFRTDDWPAVTAGKN